ncbi:two-component sensor histidine kinase [Clostridium tetani]|uniref:histidine kinase n=2 Tax=Clostridium tetani TaxID=1513 RepID=Q899I6_CLOTE|nr:HAMP domain-containing sensor histidine kinase [Clostridium tetani]AAO34840.1 sensory transduction histidine kinase [Clostridium tetani E88]AVP55940.1 sensor histidine kinase [Clostridium tetani]KGI38784.1 histidine kinase [Clostridium tetani ATCC 9441]KGI40685.1 histidine kinase [Clostridium tetani]KGI43522.1 histidine kinase [Clostridium tetani]
MKKSLFSKLIATFTAIITISFVVTAAFLSYWFEGYYFQQRKNQLVNESQFISVAAVNYLEGNFTKDRITEILNNIGNYLSTNIWLADNYGIVYAVSNDKYDNIIGRQVLIDELDELRFGNSIEKREVTSPFLNVPVHTFVIPVFYKDMFKGSIIMHTSVEEIKEPLKKVYNIIWLSAILAIMFSFFVIYYFSQRIIIKPLEKINYVADKISKGEVDKRVFVNSEDEIGDLANSFNAMAESLEKIEENRRSFISNVSHEIRSPITSIKGFISGILDGVIPSEKQNYYLALAYDETQRLTRLVNDLLDLSAIEAGQLKLRIEEVNINEIIRLTVIKFKPLIDRKNLDVDICLQEDDLYVVGDKDRLFQVMINLIDNAIKYTVENGKVEVRTKLKGNKVYVSIYNSGKHIPEEDIKNVWSRFYKVDKSRTSKVSTGLGLSIVRSILTQLGEDIWVKNVDAGVLFTFSLKKI